MFKTEPRDGGIVREHTRGFGRGPDMTQVNSGHFQTLDDTHDVGIFQSGNNPFALPMLQPLGGVIAQVQVLEENRPGIMRPDKFGHAQEDAPPIGARGFDQQGDARAIGCRNDGFHLT